MRRRFKAYTTDQEISDYAFARLTEAEAPLEYAESSFNQGKLAEVECARVMGKIRHANFLLGAVDAAVGTVVSKKPEYGHSFHTLYESSGQRLKRWESLPRAFVRACIQPAFAAREKAQDREDALANRRVKEAAQRAEKRAAREAPGQSPEEVRAEIHATATANKAKRGKPRMTKERAAEVKAELERHRAEMRARNEAEVGRKPPMEHEARATRKACRVKVTVEPAGCTLVED